LVPHSSSSAVQKVVVVVGGMTGPDWRFIMSASWRIANNGLELAKTSSVKRVETAKTGKTVKCILKVCR
jgi:hypothetical protein